MLAQPLNSYLIDHWQLVASVPYFTKNGLFVTAVFCAPMLLLALLITVRPTPPQYCVLRAHAHNIAYRYLDQYGISVSSNHGTVQEATAYSREKEVDEEGRVGHDGHFFD